MSDTILSVWNLKQYFPITAGIFRFTAGHVRAVDGVSFDIKRGTTLGLVGESGCGKTTTGKSILRLYTPTDGSIRFRSLGEEPTDLAKLSGSALRSVRSSIQMVFQDPYSSLNPRLNIRTVLEEGMKIHESLSSSERTDRVGTLLKEVGLKPGYMSRYPHEFSGGQRQRIGIARALSVKPELLICDEPLSALDVSIQAQIIQLLRQIQKERHLSFLFISHDLAVVECLSDEIAVMYLGRIVEKGTTEGIIRRPRHPYTRELMRAVPVAKIGAKRSRVLIKGEVPSAVNPPSGCHFHPRCSYAKEICRNQAPELINIGGTDGVEHLSACHFAKELKN